jgi:hypothetical protein
MLTTTTKRNLMQILLTMKRLDSSSDSDIRLRHVLRRLGLSRVPLYPRRTVDPDKDPDRVSRNEEPAADCLIFDV